MLVDLRVLFDLSMERFQSAAVDLFGSSCLQHATRQISEVFDVLSSLLIILYIFKLWVENDGNGVHIGSG